MALSDYDRNAVTRGLQTAEDIKQRRYRSSIMETAAKYAPRKAEQEQQLGDLAIQKGTEGLAADSVQRARQTETYDQNKMLQWLTLGQQSLPYVRDEKEYQDWSAWMQEKGVPAELMPKPPEGAQGPQFQGWIKQVVDAAHQKQLELIEARNQGQREVADVNARSRREVAKLQLDARDKNQKDFTKLTPESKVKIRQQAYQAWTNQNMQFAGYYETGENAGEPKYEIKPGAPEFNDKWVDDYFAQEVAAAEGGGFSWRDY